MQSLFWPLFLLVIAVNIMALVFALRVAKTGKAIVAWVEDEFPDAVADMPKDLRRRGALHVIRWLDAHIDFPDEEFAERQRDYMAMRKRSNLTLAACVGFLILLTLYGRPPEA